MSVQTRHASKCRQVLVTPADLFFLGLRAFEAPETAKPTRCKSNTLLVLGRRDTSTAAQFLAACFLHIYVGAKMLNQHPN